jgi:hypothetical protein
MSRIEETLIRLGLLRASRLFLGVCVIAFACSMPSLAHAADPGTPGPFAVSGEEYSYGLTAFTPTGFPGPVELIASVHYPTDLSAGPFPLVIFLHGRHRTCYDGANAVFAWPCTAPYQPIPSYRGFDYISTVLASHGYVVISLSANGISAQDAATDDFGALARAELIQKHLDIWSSLRSTGGPPFGTKFVGKVDLSNVGTVGHSAGGEGAVRHVVLNASLGSPYGVRAVLLVAPANDLRLILDNVPFGVLLPYCDGIATRLPGVHYFDDARYSSPGDPAAKHMILVMGANHNYYNSVWTVPSTLAPAIDDWSAFVSGGSSDPHCGGGAGSERLTAAQQHGTGLAYASGFLRAYLGGESAFLPMLRGDEPPPPSAMTDAVHVSYHAPDDPVVRQDLNRLLNATNLATNTLGGAVYQGGFTPYDLCGGESPEPQHCLPGQPTTRQPHTAPSALSAARGLSQLRGGWSSAGAFYGNDLPVGFRDISGFQALQFRVSVNFGDPRNPAGQSQDFTVRLTDGTGATASTLVSDWSSALFYPPGSVSPVPKVVLNTVRIPLSAMLGVDLTDIRSVKFVFDRKASGSLLISDIAFASQAIPGSVPTPYSQLFACGGSGSFSETIVGVSRLGNITEFTSPTGAEHIAGAPLRSGYQVCYATGPSGPYFTSFDFGATQAGWGGNVIVSQPNGPNTFPLEIARTTTDGKVRITRRFTGNSFVVPVPAGNILDLNGDGQACSTMQECGNCSNRTVHVMTKVENLTGGSLFDVAVVELVDLDIGGTAGDDRFVRTSDSVFAYEDLSDAGGGERAGLLLQGLVLPTVTGVLPSGAYGAPADCAIGSVASPTTPGNFEALLRQGFGLLGPGSSTGSSVRTHYRRF